MTVFTQKGDARDYLLMASSTFLVFLSHSTLAFLPVILRDLGVKETGIGVIMSAPLVPMLVGMFLSGYLMERLGPLRVVRAGFIMILLAHLSIEFTVTDFAGVYISRAFHGFGYGIFITPLIGGWVMDRFSLGTYLAFLIALAFAAVGLLGVVKGKD